MSGKILKNGLVLVLVVLLGFNTHILAGYAHGRARPSQKIVASAEENSRIAPDLEELLLQDEESVSPASKRTLGEARKQRIARSVKTASGQTLLPSAEVAPEENQSFIVRLNESSSDVDMKARLARYGGRVTQRLSGMGLVVVEMPRSSIRQFAAEKTVSYISPDRPVSALGHIEETTGAANIRWALGNYTEVTGEDVGVAILDSGVDNGHKLVSNSYYAGKNCKVYYNHDFTGNVSYLESDSYGHGTHVFGLLAGTSNHFNGAYRGIASGAKLLNLRVLDGNGAGTVSTTIAAIDWCIANKSSYNLRVLNLSLGAMAKDSYKNDPLCLAARRAYNAGIVVVAAAGNDGKDANGRKIYGGIHSPGIDPCVITVGAANTFGTDARSDDKVTSFSSRGPTRGYVTVNGVRKYDNLIKPDLVAPGNKLVSAQSDHPTSSTAINNLVTKHPSLNTKHSASINWKTMYMSGTSMSAPVVAGAAALMLQANPNLTPSLVKAILMYTAQPLKGFNTLEQGAGELNIDGAVRMALLVKSNAGTLTNGALMLNDSLPASQSSYIAGQTCYWGKGIITNFGFLHGDNLMKNWQGMYGSGVVVADGTVISSGQLVPVSTRVSSGVSVGKGAVSNNGLVLSDGVVLADGVALANGANFADGVVVGDGIIIADGIVLSDGRTRADVSIRTDSIIGDNTVCMTPHP